MWIEIEIEFAIAIESGGCLPASAMFGLHKSPRQMRNVKGTLAGFGGGKFEASYLSSRNFSTVMPLSPSLFHMIQQLHPSLNSFFVVINLYDPSSSSIGF